MKCDITIVLNLPCIFDFDSHEPLKYFIRCNVTIQAKRIKFVKSKIEISDSIALDNIRKT